MAAERSRPPPPRPPSLPAKWPWWSDISPGVRIRTSPDTIEIYTPGTNLALDTPQSTSAVVDQSTFRRLSMWGSGTAPTMDEIRFGATYEDVIGQGTNTSADLTPPTPATMSFASPPATISDHRITMTATTATDANGVRIPSPARPVVDTTAAGRTARSHRHWTPREHALFLYGPARDKSDQPKPQHRLTRCVGHDHHHRTPTRRPRRASPRLPPPSRPPRS